jgi:hypothetical protein
MKNKLKQQGKHITTMKYCVTTVLMPDNILYVGITEEDYGQGITVSTHNNENETEQACKQYSITHNIPLFEEYREEGITECIMQY